MIRAAALLDVPGICLLDGAAPDPEVLNAAKERGVAVIVSYAGKEDTCGHLSECLAKENARRP